MARKSDNRIADTAKVARRVEREFRAANDPWFGKKRRAGEMGRDKTRAAMSRNACRGRVAW